MGFKDPVFPAVEPEEFLQRPLMERIRVLSTQWAEFGFGTPYMIHVIYVFKLLVFYGLGGLALATLTSGMQPFALGEWWNQPIVYQKLVLWTVLLEAIGIAGSWGPLAGKAKPMTGGILFWARPERSGCARGSGSPARTVIVAPCSTSPCTSRCWSPSWWPSHCPAWAVSAGSPER
ncbi:hypothetical protein MTP03_06680 [Tsukamurella sp. PLM1]|nr:hypothetical protein MTP03_06680 [Tsukamurella sp. PLM1]